MTTVDWIDGADRPGDVRLFCLPHAGGGSRVFRPWISALAPAVAVCPVLLPAREQRWREPPVAVMAELVEPLCQAIGGLADRPFALFGHSMGAAIAHAVAVRLHGRPEAARPWHLFVSGRPAPWLLPRVYAAHRLPDQDFLARLRLLNGTPAEVLAEPALLAALLPVLRSDFAVSENYHVAATPRLDLPVTAFGGRTDPLAEPDELLAWRSATTGPFALRVFPGDHFYLTSAPAALLAAITGALTPKPAPAGRVPS